MVGQRVDEALEVLGKAINRLESAVAARADRLTRDEADSEATQRDVSALRDEYAALRGDYTQLRDVVEQVDGRLDGTVARLRALLDLEG
jgi:chromosome segregation ATPase